MEMIKDRETKENRKQIFEEIEELKRKENAIILAHYYALPELQKAADFLGDSLALARRAGETNADVIVFCGVQFMAETASIISPEKRVLIPVKDAGCSLAEGVNGKDLAQWKKQNPDGLVVSYVNTTADVKAETDWCVTSSNALKVIKQLPEDRKILFCPDKNLGRYLNIVGKREMELWDASCYVHAELNTAKLKLLMEQHPDAECLIHPESICCGDPEILNHPHCHIGSTSFIMNFPATSQKTTFIVGTESGAITELQRRYPSYTFIEALPENHCEYMKLTSLEDLRDALRYGRYEVKVPEELRKKAIIPIERMLRVG